MGKLKNEVEKGKPEDSDLHINSQDFVSEEGLQSNFQLSNGSFSYYYYLSVIVLCAWIFPVKSLNFISPNLKICDCIWPRCL